MGRKPKVPKEPITYPGVREKDGRFTYRYSVPIPGIKGRKQKETPSFQSAKEAFEAGIMIKAELKQGTYVDEQNISFSDWCDKWLEMYKATGKPKDPTVDNRKACLVAARKYFENKLLKDITKEQYQGYLNDLKKRGRKRSTIEAAHAPMKMLFEKAVELGVVKTVVTNGAEIPTFRKTIHEIESGEELPKYLEKEELALLLKTAKETNEPQLYRILFVLAYTGLRIGELSALKVTDIDEVNRQISITKTLNKNGGISKVKLGTPKSTSSIRKVDVSDRVIKILHEQAAWRKEYQLSVGANYYQKEKFVFINAYRHPGKPMTVGRVGVYMRGVLKLAKLPSSLTPHSLRHTYTSLMAEAGVELPAIQRLLGHRNDKITELVYLHVTKTKKREAVEKLDKLMDGLF